MLFPSWRRQRRRLLILDIGAHLALLSSLVNVTRINNQTNHDSQHDDEHATYQKQPLSFPFADLLPRHCSSQNLMLQTAMSKRLPSGLTTHRNLVRDKLQDLDASEQLTLGTADTRTYSAGRTPSVSADFPATTSGIVEDDEVVRTRIGTTTKDRISKRRLHVEKCLMKRYCAVKSGVRVGLRM